MTTQALSLQQRWERLALAKGPCGECISGYAVPYKVDSDSGRRPACPNCKGTGSVYLLPDSVRTACRRAWVDPEFDVGMSSDQKHCPKCDGAGYLVAPYTGDLLDAAMRSLDREVHMWWAHIFSIRYPPLDGGAIGETGWSASTDPMEARIEAAEQALGVGGNDG